MPAGLLVTAPGPVLETLRMNDDVTVKGAPLDVPPPGAGLTTVTVAVPALAMSAAGIAAVS